MRSCGGCTACCNGTLKILDPSIEGVNGGEVTYGNPCRYLCESGCSEYESRPKVCRTYECLWIKAPHMLPDWMQPSKCGVIVDIKPTTKNELQLRAMSIDGNFPAYVYSFLLLLSYHVKIPLHFNLIKNNPDKNYMSLVFDLADAKVDFYGWGDYQ